MPELMGAMMSWHEPVGNTKSGLTTPFIKKDNLLICDRQSPSPAHRAASPRLRFGVGVGKDKVILLVIDRAGWHMSEKLI
jgi:hypothetical protein